jgi:hypothetical protein
MEYQYNFFQKLDESIKMDATPQGALLETEACPVCGEEVVTNGRCKTCYSCGWSSCDL